jgi:hypothetical protein
MLGCRRLSDASMRLRKQSDGYPDSRLNSKHGPKSARVFCSVSTCLLWGKFVLKEEARKEIGTWVNVALAASAIATRSCDRIN